MLRRALYLLAAFSAATSFACSAPTEDVGSSDDEITDVRHTPVKEQTIGNCWLYASVAWAESLHESATNETKDLSESYLTYWHWYEQIARFSPTDPEPKLQTGGFFSVATHLMTTYGLIAESDFIPAEGTAAASQRQRTALSRIEAALKAGGELSKAEQRTPANIRAVLNAAYDLSPEVRASLDATFGKEAPTPLAQGRETWDRILTPWTFKVTSKAPGRAAEVKTLDVVTTEWEEAYVYGDEAQSRGAVRRMQKAMHDSLPALITWNVDWASNQSDGVFKKRPTSKLDKWDGAHMTVVEDYQAISVPDHGTLPVGVTVTDPKVLDAALAEQARIGLIRIKNSWGYRQNPSGDDKFKGYYDLHRDYLFDMHGLSSVIVPRAYDASAPAGQTDVCATGGRARQGVYCAKTITGNAADNRLLTCANGMSSQVRECTQGCKEMPDGTPDTCNDPPPPNPCANGANMGPGAYCGASLGITTGAAANFLYSCQKDQATGQMISPFTACANGCKVQPPGVPDSCN